MMINVLILGILLGGVYGCIGLGLSLIFAGVKGEMNVAHGHFLVFASYISVSFAIAVGLDPILSLIILIPIFFVFGFAVQFGLLNRMAYINPITAVLMLMGISFVMQNFMRIVWKPDPRSLAPYASYAFDSISIGSINIPLIYLIGFILSAVTALTLHLFFNRTYMGRAIKATSEDHVVSQLLGVNPDKIYSYTFGIGSITSAIAGIIIGMIFTFTPASGLEYMLLGFGVVVLGGFGSIIGALFGGIIMGVAQLLSAHYIGIEYQMFVAMIVILVVLTVKPEGLFGEKGIGTGAPPV